MKDKNLLADIDNKSLEELNNLANEIINNLEKKYRRFRDTTKNL